MRPLKSRVRPPPKKRPKPQPKKRQKLPPKKPRPKPKKTFRLLSDLKARTPPVTVSLGVMS